jgi:chromosome segregation ATPase
VSQKFSTNGLTKFLEANISAIEKIRKEVEEIQLGFQNAYVEWKTKHDQELVKLTELVQARLPEIGSELREKINTQLTIEDQALEKRRKDLQEEIIPLYEQELDRTLAKGQAKTAELRKLNPELNDQEESLKQSLQNSQQNLIALNQKIKQLSGGLGGILHFGQISELDRQRQRLIGGMQEQQKSLQKVRQDWEEMHQVAVSEDLKLQANWQNVLTNQAARQAELNYLSEESNRRNLALQRAVRQVLDNLKAKVNCPTPDLQTRLDQMVDYNRQTDDYQDGLASVGGLIGMLGSIQEGMRRFNTSIESLQEQEQMNSQYLKPLAIVLDDQTLAFTQQWDGLKKLVVDEKAACDHPAAFIQSIQPVLNQQLSNQSLQTFFNRLGDALKAATDKWG